MLYDLPPWRTVYKQFEAWRQDGTWDRLMDGLRRAVRQPKRAAEPTAGVIDTQSVRTGAKRGAVTATMQASKWLAESDLLSWTPKAWLCRCRPPRSRTRLARARYWPRPKPGPPDLQLVWGDGRYQGPLVAQASRQAGRNMASVSYTGAWVKDYGRIGTDIGVFVTTERKITLCGLVLLLHAEKNQL